MPDPQSILIAALKHIMEARDTLSRADAGQLLNALLDDPSDQLRIAALLGALAARGETTDELAGFVDTLRARVTPIPLHPLERALLVDTCGTGGDLSGTFNISTAAALVAAAAGATVAKHGNRAVTSRAGSADVLEALGIPVDLTPEAAAEALRTHRFAFLAAPNLQPAMRALMPIRRGLGIRTAFNILGPMSNPAGAQAQVLGVYSPHLVPVVAHTLAALSTRHAFVVHGSGMDEFCLHGPSVYAEVKGDRVTFATLHPSDVGLPECPVEALAGGDAAHNANILRSIFAGDHGPRRDVIVLNAAAVLVTASLATTLRAGIALAQRTLDSGAVATLISKLST